MQSTKYPMPSALETRVPVSRSQTALNYLKVEGLKVKYVGPGVDDSEAATIRTNYPVPQDCPVYYFEAHIISKGAHGFIGIGFQAEDVLLSRLPGWDPHSYGYHGDDGYAFSGSGGQGTAYGPTYTAGDTIGALLSRVDNTIRYFKNGQDLGVAFRGMPEDRLYPCIGLRSRNEEVQVNLGRPTDPPFSSDVSGLVAAAKEQVARNISATCLPTATPQGMPLLTYLLHQHVLHHRCWKTAALLQLELEQARSRNSREAGALTAAAATAVDGDLNSMDVSMACEAAAEPPSASLTPELGSMTDLVSASTPAGQVAVEPEQAPMDAAQPAEASNGVQQEDTAAGLLALQSPHVALRQAAFELVSCGNILEARQLLETQAGPQMFSQHPHLDFRLKVAHFCELVRAGGPDALEGAVTYGRAVLAPHQPKGARDEELLCDALSLLAYEQPANSPCGHLLSQGTRTRLAEDIDRAILLSFGYPQHSALERLAGHTMAMLEQLRQGHHPQALLLDTRAACFGP